MVEVKDGIWEGLAREDVQKKSKPPQFMTNQHRGLACDWKPPS